MIAVSRLHVAMEEERAVKSRAAVKVWGGGWVVGVNEGVELEGPGVQGVINSGS